MKTTAMTESREPANTAAARPARSTRKPSPVPVFLATATLFAGVMGFLGVQMAAGQDPALGTMKPKTAAVQPARRILVRKVIVTRHVTVVEAGTAATSPSGGGEPAPAQKSTAPAQTYAPPVRTSTPPPAPAPVVTASS